MHANVRKFELDFTTPDGGHVHLTQDDIADFDFEIGAEAGHGDDLWAPGNPDYRGPGWVGTARVTPIYLLNMRLTGISYLMALGEAK